MNLSKSLRLRFADDMDLSINPRLPSVFHSMISRGSCRQFKAEPVDEELCRLLCAAALAAPTKSDLQQRDIVLVRKPEVKAELVTLVSDQAWIRDVPNIAVFCGNHLRQRQLHELTGHAFANDHLDAFFNASVDAAIALSAFVTAAEAAGLGCCPISAVRNEAEAVGNLLGLPDLVFPVAGLAFGYPKSEPPTISMRLPLSETVHIDRFENSDSRAAIEVYDLRRRAHQPYGEQRAENLFGNSEHYGWSEDKSRQYAQPERQDFGAFIKNKGFTLD